MQGSSSGKIGLNRLQHVFEAGFAIRCGDLPALAGDLSFLSVHEREYYDRLQVGKRKLSFLLGRMAAKTAISELLGRQDLLSIEIGFGVFQFPVVKTDVPQNLQVSISHCNEVAVALAFPEEHPMGIDIESIDQNKTKVIKGLVVAGEAQVIMDTGLLDAAGYTALWTIKEALSKIIRTGLTIESALLEVKTAVRMGDVYISTFRHFLQYKAISFPCDGYMCSIVLPKGTSPALDDFLSAAAPAFMAAGLKNGTISVR